jgi:ABC-2 type transport system permease protein
MLPWNYFASSLQRANRSILESKHILSQITFPRYLLPVSAVLANLLNFLPTLVVLLVFLIAFKVRLTFWVILLPLVILIQTALIIGLALLVSSLQVIYRDVEYVLQIMLMALFFLTPAVYTLEELVSKSTPFFLKIYLLNPLVAILNLYRGVFIQGYFASLPQGVNILNTVISPVLWAIVALIVGHFIFHKLEENFFDHLKL